ncbi:helix-turn-helix domain-containing protein [Mangrovihabitans endophyticus]|uniref:HTH cro/C1-type domain-containing protein n=1 Tax=Mangrovihabitans endophyticus TaxID=1751298 RepID=A0A8J3C053_9ACTN|nr:helix-turn-helix transcriptional regulator [Mangrovihabitans endophyticus]GGK90578.1 hypothetical protein GCM10012284_25530 [Mangrovihabitans endophyticus]
MVLLRRVIGDALRARRQGQHRTLREVSTAANVSLGYLSEIERGQKEASSELLAAICDALGARLSELLGDVSGTLALAEGVDGVLAPVRHDPVPQERVPAAGAEPTESAAASSPASAAAPAASAEPRAVASVAVDQPRRQIATEGTVSISVHQDSPLKATLRTTRSRQRDVVYAA